MQRHKLDINPMPKDKEPLFINDPELAGELYQDLNECAEDNIRIYVPIDINRFSIIRRLNATINRYGEANEENEMLFSADVEKIKSLIEIYDQVWYVRHMPKTGKHSKEAIELIKEFIACLEDISDGCAEFFPFDLIDELKEEYLSE